MAFDISTATPITSDNKPSVSGFDLSSAKPLTTASNEPTAYEQFRNLKEQPQGERKTLPDVTQFPDKGFLNAVVTSGEGAAWNLIAKPILGMKDDGVDEMLKQTEKNHPIASFIGGSAALVATAPLLPEEILPVAWMRFGAINGSIGGLSAFGNARVDDSLKTVLEKAKDVAVATGEGFAMGAVMGGAQAINIIKRPFASALARAGVTFTGTTALSTFFGNDITEAFKQGGVMGAAGLILEVPTLAKTAIGRGSIAKLNESLKSKGKPEINTEAEPEVLKEQLGSAIEDVGKDVGVTKPQVLSATVRVPKEEGAFGFNTAEEYVASKYENTLSSLNLGKLKSVLDKQINTQDLGTIPKKEYIIRRMLDDSYEISETGILRKKGSVAGNALNKTETKFAQWVSNNKSQLTAEWEAAAYKEFDGASHEDALNKVGMSGASGYESGFKIIDSDGQTKFITREESIQRGLTKTGHSHEVEGLNQTKFTNPPEEPKIVNPDVLAKIEERKKMGETGQMDVRMIPGMTEIADGLTRTERELRTTLYPSSIKGGKFTAAELRENLGKFARSQDMFEAQTLKAKQAFDKASKDSSLDFIYKMEDGLQHDTPELNAIAKVLRERLDAKREEIQSLGTGKLDTFIENYFPHIWDNPKKAGTIISNFFDRKPWEGKKSFLKKRTIETTKAGIDAGLTPVTYNPIDLASLKIREMDKYLAAHRTFGAMKEQGLAKFVKIDGDRPDGWVKIDDKISNVTSKLVTGEVVLRGSWYAQPDAARIINNYSSPGLRGNYIYDMYRGGGNVLNQFQLGLSAFHLGFTSMDATISKFALGINKLSSGNVGGALKDFAKTPFAPITNILEGSKLIKAWGGDESSPIHNVIADIMATAGGRAQMDKFYATNAHDSMMKAMKEQKYASAALKIPTSFIEALSKPIMEYIVPRQKLGVFSDMMKMELERNPNMSHEQLRDIAQKAWDSVDNRMGQLVYDNLFWNKTVKDISMASVRSLGWNLGTLREIGGGTKDIIGTAKNIMTGKGSSVSYRTAYVLALPAVSALYGAMYQYLATGEGPKEFRDYFFPKTGGIDKKGMPARVSLPTYMKDVYHYSKNPIGTLTNKFNPINGVVLDMLRNKDFYGTKIHNEDDPLVQQALDEMGYVAQQFIPFGVRNAMKDTRSTVESKVEPFIGIVPAPSDVSFTKAEARAHELAMQKIPSGSRTKEQAEKSKVAADVRNAFFSNGDEDKLNASVDEGKITERQKNEIIKEKDMTNLERLTRHLSYDEVLSVYKKANDDEKAQLKDILETKRENKMKVHSWSDSQEELYTEMFGDKE